MRKFSKIYSAIVASVLLVGCSETLEIATPALPAVTDNGIINIGGVTTDQLLVSSPTTRATVLSEVDAETQDWLVPALTRGLDITYGITSFNPDGTISEKNKHVAILQLQKNEDNTIKYSTFTEDDVQKQLAIYTFNYKTTEGDVTAGDPAKWYDNGPHFFEGVYVPETLRNKNTDGTTNSGKASNLTTDQSGSNYTELSHYLGMPADCRISATISRIKLPFKHRLARVLAFVLIDPEMGEGITIRGYKSTDAEKTSGKDDPKTSEIRFGKVKVLQGVTQSENGALYPEWTSEPVRKVIPHYVGQYAGITNEGVFINGNEFVMYHHKKRDTYIAPSSNEYSSAESDFNSKGTSSNYEKIIFKNTPCYDLIVKPSYSDAEHVMYDEPGFYKADGTIDEAKRNAWAASGANKNMIEFEVTLSNGLHYTKEFDFSGSLDANFQTVVYLRIHKESIDYDNSGSKDWIPQENTDGFYGVNNQNGDVLSKAGGSWQRAFRIGTTNYPITDGSNYNEDNESDHAENKDGQYLSEASWTAAFLQAREDGLHHGDYFVLDQNLTIDVPAGFVFTGHLDGNGHELTLTSSDSRGYIFDGLKGDYSTNQESVSPNKDANGNVIYQANVHKEYNGKNYWVPVAGYRAEFLNTKFFCDKLFKDGASITGYINNCTLNGTTIDHIPNSIPIYK